MDNRIVIIGAGQAGAQAAISLRQSAFSGEIVIVGAEATLPYQRPPLSKAYLKGELQDERLYLRPAAFYDSQNIEFRLGEQVEQIDRATKTVFLENGEDISYDKMLITTGARPRRLEVPGVDLSGIYYLRTIADSNALRAILTAEGRICIVGAGYIGLEVAAVARTAGREVTVIELASRVLARVASEPISSFYEELHRNACVDLVLGASLERLVGDGEKLTGVELASGEVILCCATLIGIGAHPEVTIARQASLNVENGIVVDEYARTSDEHIWAAGDCANFPSPRYGRRLRLESVPNAIEQAKVAAANMAGRDIVYDRLPWFWSDQFDVKLQSVGLSEGYDKLAVRGEPSKGSFSVWYFKDGKVLAVDAINDPAPFAISKKLILAGTGICPTQIVDRSSDLKHLIST